MEEFPYEHRTWYPHMGPADTSLWNRFITAYPQAFDYCEYDVCVGEGPDFSTIVNSATGGDDKRLYKKKIDVVGHTKGKTFIIEVKPNAGLGAFGQALSYEVLYLEHIDPNADTEAMIVTDRLAPDMKHLADQHQVQIMVV